MPPVDRPVPRFAAEPPHAPPPSGPRADRLRERFLLAARDVDAEGADLGDPETVIWFPDRTWHDVTFVPATARTSGGFELFGLVAHDAGEEDAAGELDASVDFTDETADRHPEWQLDLCDEVVGRWRGTGGDEAKMTLVWGTSLVADGAVAIAELGDVVVDQCTLVDGRFTLLAPDDYGGATLDVVLYGLSGAELARESLYAEDDGDDDGDD